MPDLNMTISKGLILLLIATLTAFGNSFAEDDSIDIEKIKEELRISAEANSNQNGLGGLSAAELDKQADDLKRREAELLSQAEALSNADTGTANVISAAVSEPPKESSATDNNTHITVRTLPAEATAPAISQQTITTDTEKTTVNSGNADVVRIANDKVAACDKNLAASRTKVSALLDEINTLRNKLMLAETEVARLSTVVAASSKARIMGSSTDNKATAAMPAKGATITTTRQIAVKTEPDMLVATVSSDKAYLRAGPSKDDSPLMSVRKGTKLAVETRNGNWYRVIAPSGSRAWVNSEVLTFNSPNRSFSTGNSAVKIKGYDSRSEEAFKLVANSAGR